jgi:3-oxoacyl-[acyl-carrier-protein] synthase II
MGAITPIGLDKEEYWENLLAGLSGVRRFEFPDTEMAQYRTQIAATVEGFDPEIYLPPDKKTRYFGRTTLLAMAATKMALEDAGFTIEFDNAHCGISGQDPSKIGVILGAAAGNMEILEKEFQKNGNGTRQKRFSPHSLPYHLISAIPASVAILFGCQGVNYPVSTSCTSASQAIGNSYRHLQNGWEDIIITGGADSGMNPTVFGGFMALRAMSARNEDPVHASRPFDLKRDGFIMGEGAGILILEKLEHALRRNAPIYAEVKGFGMTADSYHLTVPDPEGRSLTKAIRMALEDAGVKPEGVDYINAHGTSTKLNDAAETTALKQALGKYAYGIPISSTKSMTGHLLGAAGGIEFIAAALAIQRGMIPPTINYEVPDPECDLDYVPNVRREKTVDVAMSTSLGFGGFNTALVAAKFEG